MRWFGASWGAPVCEHGEHVPTPIGELCEHCGATIELDDEGLILAYFKPSREYAPDEVIPVQAWDDFPVHLCCLMDMTGGRIRPVGEGG